ncbi:hypothetical protein [Leptospira vanthielii]|uniref:Uncharacterized protein n=1 Tax=Leptospira vanthielii serovar Holland str. Waz Holland = ATCC 700522 TaxID=1218591 RepID=N1W872_9LEPT|nr:hypothetical protein [Leptospira vanthielii]EMY71213.1 hypothetical protein LEP1GSC199_0620 [Leptospira vanthielii serovar Holland str. Waz Holland = ATCC 700522]
MQSISYLEEFLERRELFNSIHQFTEEINKIPIDKLQATPEDLLSLFLSFFEYNTSIGRSELYLKFLTNFTSRNKEFLRSYIIIFNELELDELKIVEHIRTNEIEITDTLDLNRIKNQFENQKVIKTSFPENLLSNKHNEKIYLDHLISRNIITWPVLRQDPIITNNTQTGVTRHSKIILTPYGRNLSDFIFG